MSLRVRLIVAFFLLSVVPLAAVTFYTYASNSRALHVAAQHEAEMLTGEVTQRMQVVTTQIGDRVEHLMDMPMVTASATGTSGKGKATPRRTVTARTESPAAPASPAPPAAPAAVAAAVVDEAAIERQVAGTLGEVAMLLNNVEGRGLGRRGAAPAGVPAPFDGLPGPSAAVPPATPEPGADPNHIKVDLAPIRRDLFREMAPNGRFDQMTPEERQRIGREVNQRLLGIVQGLQLSGAELQKKADAAKQQAETERTAALAAIAAEAKATPPAPPAKPMTRQTALSGTRLNVRVEQNGQVVRQVNAEINLPNLLATVFANPRADSGEIPFAVGKDGHLYTPADADRTKLAALDVARVDEQPGTKRVDDWVIVTTPDRSGAGLRFGIARPVGNLLKDLRRTTARNASFGLLFIGLALVGMVPLSGRLTRNLTSLTEGVGRIAHGDYTARVPVKSRDEIGRLAAAFNQMAADVEQHQRSAVEQERIRRELELGRRIQADMLPRTPLHFGLTEVKGVSVPAREVGGDFFNYFALDSGLVALLVGDVSGKGVGAALLMANIQASLRTRFALGQGLSAIAEAIDRDIEANSPGPVYATLFIALLDPVTRRMRYVNAGHNPQFALRVDGRLEKMSSTGLPVGMLAGHGYSERAVQLAAGDLLFFYTDGCVEMENEAGDMFGSDRLEALVAKSGRSSADEVLTTVERAITTFRGGRDLFRHATMMVVRVG